MGVVYLFYWHSTNGYSGVLTVLLITVLVGPSDGNKSYRYQLVWLLE